MKRPLRRKFYIYEHWRPDRNICFYVGKGFGKRAWGFKRNLHYNRVIAKLSRLGMCVEVRMIERGLGEREAFVLEKTRIAFWRARHKSLTNLTDGGEGSSGIKYSEERRAKISEAGRGRKQSIATRNKRKATMSNWSLEKRIKIGLISSKRFKGIPLSPEHCAKLSVAHKGHKHSLAHKRKIGKAHRGKKVSSETRARQSVSIKAWHAKLGHKINLTSIELQ